jgi:hypothetical protein
MKPNIYRVVTRAIEYLNALEEREFDHAHDLQCPVVAYRYDHDEEEWAQGPKCNCVFGRLIDDLKAVQSL